MIRQTKTSFSFGSNNCSRRETTTFKEKSLWQTKDETEANKARKHGGKEYVSNEQKDI